MMDNFEHTGSNWVFFEPTKLTICLIKDYDSFSKAKGYISSYDWLNKRRTIINIRNKENNCFFKYIYRFFIMMLLTIIVEINNRWT
jgi:hypothetical protein